MPLQTVTTQQTQHGSRLIGEDIHTIFHLDIPIPPDDLNNLIIAATKTADENPRVELAGVFADRTPEGVRVSVVANTSHFDIPWPIIARGFRK